MPCLLENRPPGPSHANPMTMFRRILIPLDGSPLAECTIPYALALHKAFSPRVILYRVLEPHEQGSSSLGSVDWRLERESARQYLEGIARRFPAAAKVEIEVVTGPAPMCIVEMIRRSEVDLVLLSTHGVGGLGSFPLGGTAHKVVSAAETSVLVVRAGTPTASDQPAHLDRIQVGVDGSPNGEWAAHVGAAIASASSGELLLTHVATRHDTIAKHRMGSDERRVLERVLEEDREEGERRLERLAAQVGSSNIVTRTRVELDSVAPALDEIARREEQSLIVIGAHGRSPDSPWFYGSVAAGLIQNGTTPVLVLQDTPRRSMRRRPARRPTGHSSTRLHTSYAWSP